MRREQFYAKYQHLGVDQRELERKYQSYLREQEETMFLYEAAQKSSSSSAPGLAGGGGSGGAAFYTFATNTSGLTGFQFNVDPLGNLTQVGNLYNGMTVFCKNPDTGVTYYVEQDTDEEVMVVGILNPVTGSRQVINSSALDEYYSPPASLFYVGNNQFLYLNNVPFFGPTVTTIQNILLLSIVDNVVTIEDALGTWNYDGTYILTSAFKIGDDIWAALTPQGYPLAGVGKLAFDPVDVLGADILLLENIPFTENWKAWFTTGIAQTADGIYINIVVNDKVNETMHSCIAKLDAENYTSQYVQDISIDFSGYVPADIEAQ